MQKKRKTKSSRPSRQVASWNSHFAKKVQLFFRQFLKVSSFRTKALLLLGIILVLIPTFFYVNEGVQLAFFTPKVPVVKKQFPAPTWISIPAVQMELPIIEEAINGNTWGVAEDGISHLNVSARPGEVGPIILYGH